MKHVQKIYNLVVSIFLILALFISGLPGSGLISIGAGGGIGAGSRVMAMAASEPAGFGNEATDGAEVAGAGVDGEETVGAAPIANVFEIIGNDNNIGNDNDNNIGNAGDNNNNDSDSDSDSDSNGNNDGTAGAATDGNVDAAVIAATEGNVDGAAESATDGNNPGGAAAYSIIDESGSGGDILIQEASGDDEQQPANPELSILSMAIDEFTIVDGELIDYFGPGGAIVIPDGVTAIAAAVFQNNEAVTSVVFNDELESIGANAFQGCRWLTRLDFNDGLQTIGQYAFQGCTSLTRLDFNIGLKTIGSNAFAGCTTMQRLALNQGLLTIGDFAFDGDSMVYDALAIPGTVTAIGQYAFRNCSLLTGSLIIPENVASIGQYAFQNCTGLTGSLVVPGNVVTIGPYAFQNCTGLSGILTLGDGIAAIGAGAFENCSKLTGDLIIPDSVTSMGSNAFNGCSGFNGRLQLSANQTVVNDYTFNNCNNISGEVAVPEKVTAIGRNVFANMQNITSVVFGTQLTSFYYYVFNGCTRLLELTFTGMAVPTLADGNMFINISNLQRIYVPVESYDAYMAAYGYRLPSGAKILVSGVDDLFFIEDGILKAYLGDGGDVIIPEGVTEIGMGAFQNNKGITKVTFNNGLTKIGTYAFQGCTELSILDFSDSISSIENYAFQGCIKLASLNIGNGIQSIGQYAFQNCIGLASLIANNDLKSIGNYAFTGCTNLSSISLNQGLLTIGDFAFDGDIRLLGTLTIPDSVTSIGQYAFRNCSLLSGNLMIPGSVAAIGQYAFQGCTGLDGELTLGDGIVTIGGGAFENCNKLTGDLIIPDSVTSVGSYAFNACSGFDGRLQLSVNLTVLNDYTFNNCTNISGEVAIPDKVTAIGRNVFANMQKITSVVFGAQLTSFYYYVFNGCSGLLELIFTGMAVPSLADGNMFINIANLQRIYVPRASYNAYAAAYSNRLPSGARILISGEDNDFFIEDGILKAYLGNDAEVAIPAGVIEIGMGAFQNNKELTKITLNDELTAIGSNAFQGCAELAGIVFNDNLKTIGNYAFYGCTKLAELDFNDALQTIAPYAFQNCTGLTALATNAGLESIGNYAFSGCANMLSLTLNQGLLTIGEFAFDGDNKIAGALVIPGNVTNIGQYAFRNCASLSGNLAIPGSVAAIGQYAFQGCTGLDGELALGDGIVTIGAGAFENCNKLTGDLIIPDSVTSVGSYAFNACPGFDGRLQLSANLTVINDYTFNNCTNISGEVAIPDKVTAIGRNVFANMQKITSVVFGAQLTSFYYYVFNGCSGLLELTFTGMAVPSLADGNMFINIANLQRIYVPRASYNAYAAAYSNRLPSGARILISGGDSDFFIEDGILKAYLGDDAEVAIPAGVIEIGMGAFQNNKELTKITLNDELTAIGSYAFQGCAELAGIVFNDNLMEIGSYAFYGCAKLTELDFNDTLQTIAPYAFQNCTGLTALATNAGLESIGNYAFSGCANMLSLTLNQELSTIGDFAFDGDNKIAGAIVIPGNVTNIGQYAFRNCVSLLGNLAIPGSVATIGQYAFQGCTGLDGELALGEGIVTIGAGAFENCNKLTGDLIIPDSVTSVGSYAFNACPGFDGRLQLSANMTVLNDYTFNNCNNISGEVIIPDKVTAIGRNVFVNMQKITSVVFGAQLTSFYYYVFNGCSGITELTFTGMAVPSLADGNMFINIANLQRIYVPNERYNAYVAAYASRIPASAQILVAGGDEFFIEDRVLKAYTGAGGEITIPDGVLEIGVGAFQNNKDITKVTFNDSLSVIGNYAFQGCTKLSDIVFNENLYSIGAYAFQGCTALADLIFNDAMQYIGANAFQGCTNLTTLATNIGLMSIGNYAFTGCTNLIDITLNQGLLTIGDFAFDGDNKIAGALIIPGTVTGIGQYAFRNCTLLTGDLIIPGSMRTIGQYAFQNCTGLDGTLTLNFGIVTIGAGAFENCSKLTGDLIIPDSVTSVGGSAFNACSGFDGRLQLSANLAVLNDYTFNNCNNITGEVAVPDKVTSIGRNVFTNMQKITSVVFGAQLTSFYYYVFNGCSGITELTFTGLIVPSLSDGNIFLNIVNLETIYCPALVYSQYVAAYQPRVAAGVVFSSETMGMAVPNLQAEKVYSRTVYLSWNKHVNPAVVKYIVRRDGVAVAETAECFYTDRNLATGQEYTYQVYGLTADGVETGRSNVVATPKAPVISRIRTENEANKITSEKNTVFIETVNSKNALPLGAESATGLLYYLDGGDNGSGGGNSGGGNSGGGGSGGSGEYVLIGEASLYSVSTSTATYAVKWDVGYMPEGEYTVLFRLTDIDGAIDVKDETVTVDHTGPERIVNVIAIGDISGITVSWSIAAEFDTNRYRVYRRSEIDSSFYLVATINSRNTLTFRDTTVAEDRIYYYYVVGINDLGQQSPPSEIAAGMKGVDEEPPVVSRLAPANNSYINGVANIAVTASDNVGITKVELNYSLDAGATWELGGAKTGAPYTIAFDTTQFPDGVIRIQAIAYDARDNESVPLTYVYSIDNTGPEKVVGLEYSSTSVTITLSWEDVADNDISFFRVERKTGDGGGGGSEGSGGEGDSYVTVMDVSRTLGANILGLTPETSYTYRVVGYDHLGNRGAPSDDIVAETKGDTTPPVISSIMPKPGYYSNIITVTLVADDDYAIESIAVQLASNLALGDWVTVSTQGFPNIIKKATMTIAIELSAFNEGAIYVRGIATDKYGNVSDTSETAPYVQHFIDRTPPAAPTGVQAVDRNGIIEVMWEKGLEQDIATYAVFRSTQPDSGFAVLAGTAALASLNYFDRTVSEGIVYYYKVAATDLAGNGGAQSAAVSAQISDDLEPPVIAGFHPAGGAAIGPAYRTVSFYATDNRMLEQIKIEYKAKTAATFIELIVVNAVNAYERTISAAIPLDAFAHGDIVAARATAVDKAGNISAPVEIEYEVDKEAPQIASFNSVYESATESVALTWQSDLAADLIGYKIYRATIVGGGSGGSGGGIIGNYSLIGQLAAEADRLDYVFTDYSIAKTQQQYIYRVDALDNVGNARTFNAPPVDAPNRSMPIAVINCDAVMEVGVDYEIDASGSSAAVGIVAYAMTLGDGAASDSRRVIHRYSQVGSYTINLTVTDADGNQATAEKTVQVRERALLGSARIRVMDDSNRPVKGASVYFDLGEPEMVVRQTDANGYVTFTAEVGRHTVGCIIPDNEWLPSKKDILVTAGETAEVTMTMVHQPMIEGSFEIHRMTFEEIIAAGIDVSKPENQYIVNIVVTLEYVNIGFSYNPGTGKVIGSNTVIHGGYSYAAFPIVSIPGGGGGGGGYIGDPGGNGDPVRNMSIAVIEIPITVSTLKEFFNVKLHIINNAASEFSMLDNTITLNLPDGLTIMDTVVSEKDRVVKIPEIVGQSKTTITWILRGDKIGEYWLTADYIGMLAQFNETIATKFVASDPIQVLGMTGLALRVDVANVLDAGRLYYNVSLLNNSNREVYMPNIHVGEITATMGGIPITIANILRNMLFYNALGNKSEIAGPPLILGPDESFTIRYYADSADLVVGNWVLERYYYQVSETYGLSIGVTPRPLSFFLDGGGIVGRRVVGRISSYNSKNPATIRLMQGVAVAYETTIGAEGSAGGGGAGGAGGGTGPVEQEFNFADVAPGEYSLVITKAGHTDFTVKSILVGGDDIDLSLDSRESVKLMTLLCGDINGDGYINNADLTALWLLENYNTAVTEANKACDLNGDGYINNADLTILWLESNYNMGAVVVE